MGYDFNADEIFELASQIERNGARFYRHMANNISDSSIRKLMLNFAAMEEAHEKVFLSMKKQLSDQDREKTIHDPDEETSLYLRAFADLFVFDNAEGEDFALPEGLSAEAKKRKILREAINLEWESIAFYTGMKEFVPEILGKGRVDEIIREEMRHVRLLTNNITSLKG
jgi:rubrerythrin